MSVALTTTLPAQPATGTTIWEPYGGSGYTAPLGRFLCRHTLVGDASGGTASITINLDSRYTNLIGWMASIVQVDAAAGDFALLISIDASTPAVHVCGTLPSVATTLIGANSSYVWQPPAIYLPGDGVIQAFWPNVGVGETYVLTAVIYEFDRDVRKITPITVLNQVMTGMNAPVAS